MTTFLQKASPELYRYSNLLRPSIFQVVFIRRIVGLSHEFCVMLITVLLITVFLTDTGSPSALIPITITLPN
jgi:hypothetical protein